MQHFRLAPSNDATTLSVAIDGDLTAVDVDALIRDLAAARAKMTPIHSAEPPDDPEKLHHSDNLLWTVKAAPTGLDSTGSDFSVTWRHS